MQKENRENIKVEAKHVYRYIWLYSSIVSLLEKNSDIDLGKITVQDIEDIIIHFPLEYMLVIEKKILEFNKNGLASIYSSAFNVSFQILNNKVIAEIEVYDDYLDDKIESIVRILKESFWDLDVGRIKAAMS